jgi:hypothetical protein
MEVNVGVGLYLICVLLGAITAFVFGWDLRSGDADEVTFGCIILMFFFSWVVYESEGVGVLTWVQLGVVAVFWLLGIWFSIRNEKRLGAYHWFPQY